MSTNFSPSLAKAFNRYLNGGQSPRLVAFSNRQLSEAREIKAANASLATPRQFEIQRAIRPLFGKGEPRDAIIGDHPDFAYLATNGGFERHRIATLFMDIEASTRMSLLVDLETVFRIKNAFITAAIEIVQAFDGHVHRIMGDAVMAFFGGHEVTGEQAAIDAMNAASVLRYFSEKVVIPALRPTVAIDTLGIRIGLDYGNDEDVLWACYGHPGTCEVTATSFFVDVAAKLQGNAGRNEILLGESIRNFIDFPDELVKTKKITSGGAKVDDLYVIPNYTDREGRKRNYKKFSLCWDDYLRCTPLSRAVKDLPNSIQNRMPDAVQLQVFISEKKEGQGREPYSACSRPIAQGCGLLFDLRLLYQPRIPFTVTFRVENHGLDAKNRGGANRGNHETPKTASRNGVLAFEHWEEASFRGLHYMIIELKDNRGIMWRHHLGIFIE